MGDDTSSFFEDSPYAELIIPAKRKRFSPLPLFTILKYLASAAFALLALKTTGEPLYALAILLEVFLAFCLSNTLGQKQRVLGWLVGSLLILAINIQSFVLYNGGSFVTPMMLLSLDSIEDLSGGAVRYIASAVAAVVVAFLPVRIMRQRSFGSPLLAASLAALLAFTLLLGNAYSPLYAYVDLSQKLTEHAAREASFSSQDVEWLDYYHKRSVTSLRERPETLPEQPNVILILEEGISQSVIDDERNLMPNMAKWQEQSLRFDNYFNHTFATYRGIIGQLFSGFQYNDYDINPLVSLQSLFGEQGYYTEFLNAEPNNPEFTRYLEAMGFDEVHGEPSSSYTGASASISDKELFEMLLQEATRLSGQDQPFLLVVYSFGTHVSLNSPDEKFGDGSSAILNRIYNLDVQYGRFMDSFSASPLAQSTLVVTTTDHASYADSEFLEAFPNVERTAMQFDRVPLFFSYPGVEPTTIDAGGRNTLCLVPSIVDFTGVGESGASNYFLGVSLFSNTDKLNTNLYISTCPDATFTTIDGELRPLSDEEYAAFDEEFAHYYAARNEKLAQASA